jgi:cytochrome oxidase Cu insertion factor (SCO1/SenC/PrrC family)
MSKPVLFWLALLLLGSGAFGIYLGVKSARDAVANGNSSEPDLDYVRLPPDAGQDWLKEFTLTERSGKRVGSKDLAGKVYVTSFFFSSCPANCLRQNQKVRELQQEFGKQGVQFVSITCDPDTDTPSQLREYAAKLQADPNQWWFLTGDLTYIRRIAGEMFLIAMDKKVHSEKLFVSDKWGNMRGFYSWQDLAEMTKLKRELAKLIAEDSPPPELAQKPKPALATANDAAGSATELAPDLERDSLPAAALSTAAESEE